MTDCDKMQTFDEYMGCMNSSHMELIEKIYPEKNSKYNQLSAPIQTTASSLRREIRMAKDIPATANNRLPTIKALFNVIQNSC